jgi:hypothetical protein
MRRTQRPGEPTRRSWRSLSPCCACSPQQAAPSSPPRARCTPPAAGAAPPGDRPSSWCSSTGSGSSACVCPRTATRRSLLAQRGPRSAADRARDRQVCCSPPIDRELPPCVESTANSSGVCARCSPADRRAARRATSCATRSATRARTTSAARRPATTARQPLHRCIIDATQGAWAESG